MMRAVVYVVQPALFIVSFQFTSCGCWLEQPRSGNFVLFNWNKTKLPKSISYCLFVNIYHLTFHSIVSELVYMWNFLSINLDLKMTVERSNRRSFLSLFFITNWNLHKKLFFSEKRSFYSARSIKRCLVCFVKEQYSFCTV